MLFRSSVAQIVMTRSTSACFGLNEICCVTVNVETHVTSVKTDDGVWLCGNLVHQHFRFSVVVSGGRRFLRANFVERNKHGGIDCA